MLQLSTFSSHIFTPTSKIVVSLLLLTSGFLKLASPAILSSWVHATFNFEVASWFGTCVGLVEILTVAVLWISKLRAIGFYASSILGSLFVGVSLARLIFDLKGNCGCYGFLALPPIMQSLIAFAIYGFSITSLYTLREI